MTKVERCYSIIPLRLDNNELQVLLALHVQGSYWAFPKGHEVPDEEPKGCAERELFEETDLTVCFFIETEPLQEDYHFQRAGENIHKFVTYFPASVYGKALIKDSAEVSEIRWFSIEQAQETITFDQSRALLTKLLKDVPNLHMKIRQC